MLTFADIEKLGGDVSIYSDCYKDVYGVRPRHFEWDSIEAFNKDFDHLVNVELPREMERAKQEQQASIKEFEACIAKTMGFISTHDRKDAIRFLVEAEDGCFNDEWGHDWGYFEFLNGLPYGYVEREMRHDIAA